MTPQQILIASLRLFVIVWIVETINGGFAFWTADIPSPSLPQAAAFYGVYAVCWLFIWFFPATIANLLLPAERQEKREMPKHPAPWLTTGIVLIGLWTLSRAVSDGLNWLFLYHAIADQFPGTSAWNAFQPDQKSAVFHTAAEAVLGLLLLFGAAKISRVVQQMLR
ncbi:hypothetical protein [Neisseria sp.]|uniref:hypothetical protein n=1 Tax=Neisseria sp. TaxID=192066 RepID=UPI0035A02DBE